MKKTPHVSERNEGKRCGDCTHLQTEEGHMLPQGACMMHNSIRMAMEYACKKFSPKESP